MGWIWDEIERSSRLHPNSQPGLRDPLRSAAIVAEEGGEALAAALDLTRPGNTAAGVSHDLPHLKQELIETATMAFVFLMNWEFTEEKYR